VPPRCGTTPTPSPKWTGEPLLTSPSWPLGRLLRL